MKVHCVLHKRVCIELGDFPGAIPLDRAVPSPGSSLNNTEIGENGYHHHVEGHAEDVVKRCSHLLWYLVPYFTNR